MLGYIRLLALLLIAAPPWQAAHAWGVEGHKVVALIAESMLTPHAREEIDRIMQRKARGEVSDVASWADQIRGKESRPQISHAVRIPFRATRYDESRDCSGKHRCVILGIQESEDVLRGGSSAQHDPYERQRALKLLVHYIADVHQPLHAIQETGKQPTLPERQRWLLHKVWDTIIIRSLHERPETLAARLLKRPTCRIEQGSPAQWAMESHDIARYVIYSNDYGLAKSKRPITLDRNYFKDNSAVVEDRLFAAGVRLGNVLNDIFQ